MVELTRRLGIARLIINGSFTTDQWEPNDIDCVLLPSLDFPREPAALEELDIGLPFLDIELVDQMAFERIVEETFATDRLGITKGMIEVMTLHSLRELENTRRKLKGLKEEHAAAQSRLALGTPLREYTLRSLKKLIRQLTEEIARFEARTSKMQKRQ